MTQTPDRPGIDQLRNLADRAQRHGGLTPDEAARLRDGIDALHARVQTLEHVAKGNLRHVQLIVPDLEDATQRAERAEATLNAVHVLHTHGPLTNACNDCGQTWPCPTAAVLDQHGHNPKETM